MSQLNAFPIDGIGIKVSEHDGKEKNGGLKPDQLSQIKTNHSYVIFFVLVFLLGSTGQAGWALGEMGQVGLVLDQKLAWNGQGPNSTFLNYLTIATVLPSLGLAIGAFLGGKLVSTYGSRKLILTFNLIALVFNCLKLIENTVAILVGRLAFGISTGVCSVCLSKAINDTVPAEHAGIYGAFVNAGFAMGVTLSNFMGLMIPIENESAADLQRMKDDSNWRIVLGMPILFEAATIVVLTVFIKHESMITLLQKEESGSELLAGELRKIYSIPMSMTYD